MEVKRMYVWEKGEIKGRYWTGRPLFLYVLFSLVHCTVHIFIAYKKHLFGVCMAPLLSTGTNIRQTASPNQGESDLLSVYQVV